jgi:hypothetical protein
MLQNFIPLAHYIMVGSTAHELHRINSSITTVYCQTHQHSIYFDKPNFEHC